MVRKSLLTTLIELEISQPKLLALSTEMQKHSFHLFLFNNAAAK